MHFSVSTLSWASVLGFTIRNTHAYPTQLQPHLSSQQDISAQALTLYTTSTPSHSGTLSLITPNKNTNTPPTHLFLPFTLTSTCAPLLPDWTYLTSTLLTNLLSSYPTGPTSSPYYTLHPSPSNNQDQHKNTYTITETLILPTSHQDVTWRSTLRLSITPHAKERDNDHDEWVSLIGTLHSANSAILSSPSSSASSTGFGKLEMNGMVQSKKERRRYAPSDVVFPFPVKKEEGEEENEGGMEWSAEWVYYGVVMGTDGVERVWECGSMPVVGMRVEDEIRNEKSRLDEVRKDTEDKAGGEPNGDVEEEAIWKIDL